MSIFYHLLIRLPVTIVAIALLSDITQAVPTPYAPDAWIRANNANTSYFGWDVIEHSGDPNLGSLWILDDTTPDLGTGITAVSPRIYQGNNGLANPFPDKEGHVSSTFNYYSFTETFDANIVATAPASGAGGFTTVVLQLHSTAGGDALDDLEFAINTLIPLHPWTLRKHLLGVNANGLGFHWVEWTAPGDHLPFRISMTSELEHRPVDSFQIDTFWSPNGPIVNAITAVPEPATWLLGAVCSAACLIRRRKRRCGAA